MRRPAGPLLALATALLLAACSGEGDAGPAGPDADAAGDAGDATADASDAATDADSEVVDMPETDADTRGDATPDDGGPDEDAWVQPVTDGTWEWRARDDGEAAGAHDYPEPPDQVFEYVRFEVFQPFEVRAVRLQVQASQPGELRVHLWDDLGGNSLHMDAEAPLAVLTRQVTPEDAGTWLELELAEPLRLDPGRMVYAGLVLEGADAPRLLHDAGQEVPEGERGHSLVWFSQQIDPSSEAATVFQGAAGDFLLRLEVRHVDVVQDDAFPFEPLPSDEVGVPSFSRGGFADYDGDGDPDLMTNGPRLYRNDDGVFVDVTDQALPEGVSAAGGVWGDYDDDGDPDWFGGSVQDVLLRNDDGVFVDATAGSGIDDTQLHTCGGEQAVQHVPTETAAWLDYDGDGLLDLYLGNFLCWEEGVASHDRLFRNLGDGTFEDVTSPAGMYVGQGSGLATRGTAPADYDGDGDTDLLVTNYRLHQNILWRNEGDGTFTDVARDVGVAGDPDLHDFRRYYGHSIGAVWGDWDRDGATDLFIANLAHPRFLTFSDTQTLYRSTGGPDPVMVDVTAEAGIRYQETPSNPTAWDFDADGDLDLFWTCIYEDRPSQLYRNDGPDGWTEVSYPAGLVVDNGWGAVAADIDRDGDLDLLSRQHFRNRNPWGRRALQIRPRGRGAGGTNRDGFGAVVSVTADDATLTREHVSSHGLSVQDDPWLYFGLGHHEAADVTVTFPVTGESHTFADLPAGRYTVHEDGTLTSDP